MKERKVTKKVMGCLLVVLMLLLCACDNGTGNTAVSEKTTDDSTGKANAVAEEVDVEALFSNDITVTCYTRTPEAQGIDNYEENEFFQKLAQKTGVTFDIQASDEPDTEWDLILAGGDYPEVVWAPLMTTVYDEGLDAAVNDGVFIDLAPYVEKYMPNYWNLLQNNAEARAYAYSDSGYLVSLASVSYNYEDDAIETRPAFAGMALRQDWLDTLGLEVPTTYEEWTNVLRAFKENYNCKQPLYFPGAGYWQMTQFSAGYGALSGMQNDNGTVVYGPMTDGWKDYLTMLNQWYEEGLIANDYVTNDSFGLDFPSIMNSDTGATFMVYTMAEMCMAGMTDGGSLVAAQLPVVNEGEVSQGGGRPTQLANYCVYITSALDEEKLPQLLSMFDYLYSKEGAEFSIVGEEGDTFTRNEDGSYTFTDKIANNPDVLAIGDAIDTYLCPRNLLVMQDWTTQLIGITPLQQSMSDTWSLDGSSMILPTLSLTEDENREYADIMVDVESYMAEMTNNFIMGRASIEDDWDTYVETLKTMKIEDAVAIYQAAFERYQAK